MNFFSKVVVAAALLLFYQPAWAEKRVALVVGNSNYQNAPVLPNPANDSAAIAETLKGAGFDLVDLKVNLPAADMRRALRDFADQARDADIAVVYYAGHGIEIDGTNYLIPIDAKLERDTDIYDEAFSLDRVLMAIEPARQLRLVILDACRNNPFADTMRRTVTSRSVSRGLARVEPASTNTLIAFAAKAGLTALDGNSKNSPYAAALVKYIAQPGLDLRRAFGFVHDDVLQATGNRQEPYVYGSLGGADVTLVSTKPVASAPASPQPASAQSEARHDYEFALQLNNKDALNAFLAQHPDGYYASLAKLQLARIAAQEPQAATNEKAAPADQAQPRLAAPVGQGTDQDKAPAAKTVAPAPTTAQSTPEPQQQQTAQAAAQPTAISGAAAEKLAAAQLAAIDQGLKETTGPSTQGGKGANVAATTAPLSQTEITKSTQIELRRVGCLAGAADGDWNATSRRSLAQFNRHAGTSFDTKVASADALDAIKLKPSRVCPLVCEHGFKADGDQCSKIVCAEGSFLNDDNECEKRRGKTRTAKHDSSERSERGISSPQRLRVPGARVQASRSTGQIICDGQLCRPVRSGCHLENNSPYALKGSGGIAEICR